MGFAWAVFAVAALGLMFGLPVLHAIQSDKEDQRLAAGWATAQGFSYQLRNDSFARYWSGPPFWDAIGRADNIVRGKTTAGYPFCSFAYWDRDSLSWVLSLRLPRALPSLIVTDEADPVVKALGGQAIQFESDKFNKAFRVQSDEEQFAFAVLEPRLMEWLLGPGRTLTPWRLAGADVLHWLAGPPDNAQLLPQLTMMDALADQIPQFVWDKYGAPPRPPIPA